MKQQLITLAEKFESLSRRERVLVTLTLVAAICFAAFQPIDSMLKQQRLIQQQLAGLMSENEAVQMMISNYQNRLQLDPNEDYRNQLQSLKAQHQQLDEQLGDQVVDMVPPEYMPALLQQILTKTKGVKLTGLSSIEPEPMLNADDPDSINLYRHGLKLSMTGSYFSFLTFVSEVDKLPNRLYWKRLNYKVDTYPNAKIELELYTLSLNKEFLSVAKQQ
ncbi:MAG: type 4a pilus biogenesis protein PilO [Parashewanella sp.]